MIEAKNIKPGIFLTFRDPNDPVDKRTWLILEILRASGSRKVPWIVYWDLGNGFSSECDITWAAENLSPSQRESWTVTREQRTANDFSVFFACSKGGGKYKIIAGCRHFTSIAHATRHWTWRHRNYQSLAMNRRLNKHRLDCIQKFKRTLARRRAA